MDPSVRWLSLLIVIYIGNSGVLGQTQGLSLTVEPTDAQPSPGSSVLLKCTVNTNIIPSKPITWRVRVGDLVITVADPGLRIGFSDSKRYRETIKTDPENPTLIQHILSISDVHLEDSGIYECVYPSSNRMASVTLVVCPDDWTESCDCVRETGWASPMCFGESKSQKDLKKSYDRVITGLSVCFAIAVIYGVILTVLFARDCMKILHKKRQQQLKQQQRTNPFSDSEKLTHTDLNDDAASQPESGVWSQSEGSGGNRGNNGGIYPKSGVRYPETQQAHDNAAFKQDEAITEEGQPRIVGRRAMANAEIHQRDTSTRPRPNRNGETPADESWNAANLNVAAAADLSGPLSTPHSPGVSTPGKHTLGEYFPHSQLPGAGAAPAAVQSEGRRAPPHRPSHPPRGAYTDAPRDKQRGYHDDHQQGEHTEPRRLDFVSRGDRPGETASRGAYIDDHDTVI